MIQLTRRYLLSLTALLLIVSGICHPTFADERPNIVIIMADDLGFADLGCYGSEIQTPNLDKLAHKGLRFTQFYNTAKCHSSRVSLLTGLYCNQAGSGKLNRGVTIAEVLKQAGYFTIMSGKWHLNNEPTDHGFDRYFGHLSGATNFFTGDKTFRLNGKPWNNFTKDFYTTDVKTDYALKFLNEATTQHEDKPFLLYMAYNAPHYPLQAPKEDVMKYRGKYKIGWDALRKQRFAKQQQLGLTRKDWQLSPRPDHVPAWDSLSAKEKDWEDFRMATYAAMVDRLDQNIGRLINALREKGELDNTLIMFCSDNGACPFDRTRGSEHDPWDAKSYWCYDMGWAHAGNTPFRWYKQNQHEGGISSPLIVHWPKGLKVDRGSITRQPGHLIDFMPTAIDIAKAQYPEKQIGLHADVPLEPLMGRSLLPIFQGRERKQHDYLYFQFANNRALRVGDWKLVSPRGGPWELYNLSNDRVELNNLASQHPQRVEQMAAQWFKIGKEVDRLPKRHLKPAGEKESGPNFMKRPGTQVR